MYYGCNFLYGQSGGGVNKDGSTEEMAWEVMEQDQVQYQLNDAVPSDTSEIDILVHYWRQRDGKLKVKVTVLRIGYETV